MKKLLLILVTSVALFGCDTSDDADINISGIVHFIGEWNLESRILNDVNPLPIGDEQLIITDDNSLANYKGNYERISTETVSGSFSLDNTFGTITFNTSNDTHITHRYYIVNRTLQFYLEQDNGDLIIENWIKAID